MLLIHATGDAHSRYSHYLAEILRSEGFADGAEADIATLDAAALRRHDLVILPRLSPSQAQAALLADYVQQGGRLIAFMPHLILLAKLGLKPTYLGLNNGYLHADGTHSIWQGLATAPVQVIVPAVGWQPGDVAEATTLAHIRRGRAADAPDTDTSDSIPGIALCRIGQGQAALFAYDLPHTVARLRQGDPANADLWLAGLDGIYRPSELFVGQLDPECVYRPQADMHSAFLARLIETLAPRPRLWYYADAAQRSAMVMTSDDDWSTLEQFDTLLAGMRRRQAHATFYIVARTRLTPAMMDGWEKDGHTFAVHPTLPSDTVSGLLAQEPQTHTIPAMLSDNVARHRQEFGRPSHTIRQHAVRWLGYVEAARLEANLGVRMDTNYVSVYPFSLGYMAASGRPLRFVDTDGTLIPCFQQPTQWTEETLIHPSMVFSFRWTVERAQAETGGIIRRAARQYYTPVTLNSHPVSYATYSSPLVDSVWDTARAEGMPIVSADEWLAWTEARDALRIEPVTRGFVLHSPTLSAATVLLPASARPQATDSAVSSVQLWGRPYVALTLRNLAAGERRHVAA